MKNKKKLGIVLGVIAAVVAVAVLVGLWLHFRPKTQEGSKAFTVTVVHSDGTEKEFSYKSDALYVGEVLLAKGLVKGENGEYGLYILEVDGERAVWDEDNAYWSFFIGEDYAQTGVDTTPIQDGAHYKLVYTKG